MEWIGMASLIERKAELEAALAAKGAEIAALRADAERYRFICPDSLSRQLNVVDGDMNLLNDDVLDAAIDAAMKGE